MSWHWFALLGAEAPRPVEALAWSEATDVDGSAAGILAAWPSDARPPMPSVKIDARMIDPDGPGAWVSLVLAPRSVRLLFDDPSVQGARRAVLAAVVPPRFLSTLVRGDSIFAGAVTAVADPGRANGGDPFGRIFAPRTLHVGPGLFAESTPAPAGPVIERYGSGNPWPFDRFES